MAADPGPGHDAIRVAHLVEQLVVGGAETLAVRLANARAAVPQPTRLYTLKSGGALAARVADGVPLTDLDLDRGSVRRPWSFLTGAMGGRRALADRASADRIDVLQTHLPEANFWGLMLSWNAPCALVATVHSNDEFHYGEGDGVGRRALRRRAYRSICGRCDAVVAVSDRVRDSLIRELDLDDRLAARIAVVPNGVTVPDTASDQEIDDLRRALDLQPDHRILLGAGRLTALKNFGDLIEATARLTEAGVKVTCLIAGEGEDHEALSADIARRGLDGRVRLLGARRDLDRLHQLSDVFVLCSRWEGLPLVLLEAMAAGRPVVGYRIDGTADVVTHDREGLLVPAYDVSELTSAIGGLLADAAQRQRLGTAGRQLVTARYDLRRTLAGLEAVYATAVDRCP